MSTSPRGLADFSDVKALAIDETSRARGHDDVMLTADAAERRVLFVTEGAMPRRSKGWPSTWMSTAAHPGRSTR